MQTDRFGDMLSIQYHYALAK